MTDVVAPPSNPLGGAQAQEDRFQSLFEAGAFDPADKVTPPSSEALSGTEPSGEPEPEIPQYADLDDYLTKAGMERDTFYELPVTAKVNGESKLVPLKELRDSWQQQAALTQKSQAFAEEQRQWETQRVQARTALEQQLTQAKTLGDLAHQQLLGAYQNIDWNRLRAENPTEWAVLNQEFNQAAARVQNHLAQVRDQSQALEAQRQQEIAARLPQEMEAAYARIPEWRDQTKFKAAQTEMREVGQKLGFKPEELNQIFDHRQLLALHYASQFLKLQSQAPQAVKRVQAAPKPVAAGARQHSDPKVTALKAARERLARNPRDEDAQAAVFEHLA